MIVQQRSRLDCGFSRSETGRNNARRGYEFTEYPLVVVRHDEAFGMSFAADFFYYGVLFPSDHLPRIHSPYPIIPTIFAVGAVTH